MYGIFNGSMRGKDSRVKLLGRRDFCTKGRVQVCNARQGD